ncbi:nitroreductase family protein [Streptomyces sp. OF8]|uniref:Nitroreductase family protein n=3 Tax=Streptomyces alkaliterrae TaxID=2213162 RepID=A0A7W3WYN8_9ACTN|nr:nitroreductase family protein [Streptomyces alkaliterrae]
MVTGAVLERLISAAVAAPSIHNTQPWRYRLDPDTTTVEVRSAPERSLPHADPRRRALHVSVGAALFNLRLAARDAGFEPRVRLLPDPLAHPDLLARVSLAAPGQPSADTAAEPAEPAELYAALWRRHSSRMPFSGRPLPPELLVELVAAARAEGAVAYFPGPEAVDRLLAITAEAESRNEASAGRRTESRSWVRADAPGVTPGRDGVPFSALGPQDSAERLPMRAFSDPGPGGRPPDAAFERRPTLAVLATPGDRRADWLRAGQALERLLLTATAHSVRTSMLYQPIEWPDLRAELARACGLHTRPQMIVRLGYGPEGPATPRLRLRDVFSPM